MVDKRITDFGALGAAAAADDLLLLVDVSDTTEAPTGTTKKVRADQIGTSGGLPVLDEEVLTGSAATISLTVPTGYRHLLLIVSGRGTDAAAAVDVYMQVNGDTAANYDTQRTYGAEASVGTVVATASATPPLMKLLAAGAGAGRQSAYTIDIPNYLGTTFNKNAVARGGYMFDAAGGLAEIRHWQWRSTQAITSIVLGLSAGSFAAGTVATLLGVGSGN